MSKQDRTPEQIQTLYQENGVIISSQGSACLEKDRAIRNLLNKFLEGQAEDLHEEFEVFLDSHVRTKMQDFCNKLIGCALDYMTDSIDAVDSRQLVRMDDKQLLADFNEAYTALYIEEEE